MGVKAVHPRYEELLPSWLQLEDTSEGSAVVKAARERYLPPTRTMRNDGMETGNTGREDYDSYLLRALFPEFVSEAIDAGLGVMHSKPATITLPARMEPLLQRATPQGESLMDLLQRVNRAQLRLGRVGLAVDAPTGAGPSALPHILVYQARAITNWDDGRTEAGVQQVNLVVLNETEDERQSDLTWEEVEKYRVMVLGGDTAPSAAASVPPGVYGVGRVRVADGGDEMPAEYVVPEIAGRKLNRIPFTFVNVVDIVPDPTQPPLMKVSELALAAYRSEADYRQALFLQGQETLVVIGSRLDEEGEEAQNVGAGAVMFLAEGGDAKYVGVSAAGLGEMRMALENDRKSAGEKGSSLLDSAEDGGPASGASLRIRVAARTASLKNIAKAGATALEDTLRTIAEWIGADPDEVRVEPNLDFVDQVVPIADLAALQSAKNQGMPISEESVHGFLVRNGMTTMTYEEELDAIEGEAPRPIGVTPPGGPDAAPPDAPPDGPTE